MPNPNIYSQIDQDAPNRLAQVFDPVAIGERQLAQAKTARGNRLQELVGSMNGADPAQAAQMLGREGFIDEAAKYQGLADVAQQRRDAETQRRAGLLASAHGRIGAAGGSLDALQQEYAALGMPAEQIKSKVDWVAQNVPEDQRQQYFLDYADPSRITKREEARTKAIEIGEQKAADRQAREEAIAAQDARLNKTIEAQDRRAAAQNATTLAAMDRRAAAAERATTGKPVKMTEDQGKATGWLAQADNAYANMQQAMREDPTAMRPSAAEALANKVSPDAANMVRSPARQKFMHGVESFSEAALRAATGAGVNKEEAAQKISELTPGWTDSEALAKQKLNGLKVYMDSFKVRAGPGASMVEMKSESAPAPQRTAAPQRPAGKGPSVSNW